MNDKKFIELLNLYVDREVTTEDALLLEAEVAANPGRRRVYDQYCKMQKACSMLSSEVAGGMADADRQVVIYPSPSVWRSVPLVATLAAAACVAVVVDIRLRSGPASMPADIAPAQNPLALTTDMRTSSAAMEPVFLAKLPASQPAQGFSAIDTSSPDNQLSWIGGVHMTPLFPAANSDFIADPKSGLKPVGPADAAGAHAVLEPVEMTAFRFQR
jgi:hypothetical protein